MNQLGFVENDELLIERNKFETCGILCTPLEELPG